jgi:hypothetical protein
MFLGGGGLLRRPIITREAARLKTYLPIIRRTKEEPTLTRLKSQPTFLFSCRLARRTVSFSESFPSFLIFQQDSPPLSTSIPHKNPQQGEQNAAAHCLSLVVLGDIVPSTWIFVYHKPIGHFNLQRGCNTYCYRRRWWFHFQSKYYVCKRWRCCPIRFLSFESLGGSC